jgi:acetyl esterase/lipase
MNPPIDRIFLVGLSLVLCGQIFGADALEKTPSKKLTPAATKKEAAPSIQPTEVDVRYGDHERQVLDFYRAKSTRPTPVLFFIHGGGWVSGDKKNPGSLKECLAAGISVVSINYRYSWQAQLAGAKPPVEAPLRDAARALQFIRSKAKEWNLDKTRIGASGGSAGACSSLWLAFHQDMADPKSEDPIARESTRLWCAAVMGAQTSLDPKELQAWTPNSRYGGHAFGFMNPHDLKTRDTRFAEFLEHREEVLPWIKEYSPIEHVTSDDPAIYMSYVAAPALVHARVLTRPMCGSARLAAGECGGIGTMLIWRSREYARRPAGSMLFGFPCTAQVVSKSPLRRLIFTSGAMALMWSTSPSTACMYTSVVFEGTTATWQKAVTCS